jgi:hypothetical protein
VVAVGEAGADVVVAVGAVTTVVDTVEVEVAVGVIVVAEEATEEGATGGELGPTPTIRLTLYNLPRFGSAIDHP